MIMQETWVRIKHLQRLRECPELTAVRLYQEIQAQGYAGSCSILRQFVRPLRQEQRRLGQLTVRFDTAPGEQDQVNSGHFGMTLQHGQRCPLYGFVMVLGYSRPLRALHDHAARGDLPRLPSANL